MTGEPLAESPEPAVERGRALLAAPPWSERARAVTLLAVRPPRAPWADREAAPAFWLLVNAEEARLLGDPWHDPLVRDGLRRADDRSAEPPVELTVLTAEAAARLLEPVTRRALEARWLIRHAAVVHDPINRHEGLAAAAGRLPADALERIARPLLLQALTAIGGIGVVDADAVIAAGEAAGAVTRLACVLEDGTHPPAEWLLSAARETRLGKRIASWLDDLGPALGGDERARRWVADGAPGLLREVAAALRPEFGDREWLLDPERFALRPPPQRR